MSKASALLINRYRSFPGNQRIELAPITIIIGKNGGGKSVLARLPLLLSGALDNSSGNYIDLNGGGILHAFRFEELSYQRSAQAFGLGAEIIYNDDIYSFFTTFIYVAEIRRLQVESFSFEYQNAEIFRLELQNVEALALRSQTKWKLSQKDIQKGIVASFSGLLPQLSVFSEVSGDSASYVAAATAYKNILSAPSYLGPFRAEAHSFGRMLQEGVTSLGPKGIYAVDLLFEHSDLLDQVSRWFQRNMQGCTLHFESKSGNAPVLMVRDSRRNVSVHFAETGAGFSQIFPIVVQAFAARNRAIRGSFIIVEQPELHLHPAAHGGIADLLIETSLIRPDAVQLCETHSEEVITRLRRRVAEGRIKPADIVILSVDHHGGETGEPEPIKTIRLDRFGNTDSWPYGVFDEALDDITQLRKATLKTKG